MPIEHLFQLVLEYSTLRRLANLVRFAEQVEDATVKYLGLVRVCGRQVRKTGHLYYEFSDISLWFFGQNRDSVRSVSLFAEGPQV